MRYWEQEFSTLKPTKRRGNRRYYQKKDVLMVRKIRELLYTDGYTIEGAKAQILHGVAIEPLQTKNDSVQKIIEDLESVLFALKESAETA